LKKKVSKENFMSSTSGELFFSPYRLFQQQSVYQIFNHLSRKTSQLTA